MVSGFDRFATGSKVSSFASSDLSAVLWRLPFLATAATGVANSVPFISDTAEDAMTNGIWTSHAESSLS